MQFTYKKQGINISDAACYCFVHIAYYCTVHRVLYIGTHHNNNAQDTCNAQ